MKQKVSAQNLMLERETTGKLEAEIAKNKAAIKNLVMKLADFDDAAISKHISSQIKELDERNNFLHQELVHLDIKQDKHETDSLNHEIVLESISKLNAHDFNDNEFAARRNTVKTLIEKIIWDGENMEIFPH